MSVANPTRNKRARVISNAVDETFNDVTFEGDVLIEGTLGVTGVTTVTTIVATPTATEPTALTQGQLYFDDASNTSTGEAGFRGSIDATPTFHDLPFYRTGTFTPAFEFGAAATTNAASVAVGNFARIGGVVHMQLQLTLLVDVLDTGVITVINLPASTSGVGRQGFALAHARGFTFVGMMTARLLSGTTINLLDVSDVGGVANNMTDANVPVGTIEVQLCGTYQLS